MKHMRNVIDGMAGVLGSISSSRAYIVDVRGFERDSKSLAKDARNFAADFKKQGDLVYESIATRPSKVK